MELRLLPRTAAQNKRRRHLSARGCIDIRARELVLVLAGQTGSNRIRAECFPNVLTAHVSLQNTTNADKSFEALLSHTIGELCKSDSVYRPNPEENSMVSQFVSESIH